MAHESIATDPVGSGAIALRSDVTTFLNTMDEPSSVVVESTGTHAYTNQYRTELLRELVVLERSLERSERRHVEVLEHYERLIAEKDRQLANHSGSVSKRSTLSSILSTLSSLISSRT